MHNHFMRFFEDKKVLCDAQHGFRKRRSCESQLVLTTQDLAMGLNSRSQRVAILLDFSKVFDKVPHQRLSLRHHHYSVCGNILEWVKSFLDGRIQHIVLDGTASSAAPVTSIVPQSTVLGPLLFLVYINDLPSCVKSSTHIFAGDCLLYKCINSSADSKALQEDLDYLQQWEKDWQMKFNPGKCEVIPISNKRKVVDSEDTIHGQILRRTDKAKYLGVTIDSTLSWNHHIDTITKKANNTTAFLRQNLSSWPPDVKATCYKALMRPQLEYASSIWDSRTHHWEDLHTCRKHGKMVLMYRIVNHLVDITSSTILQSVGTSRTREHNHRYLVPYYSVDAYKFAFSPSGIRLWNSGCLLRLSVSSPWKHSRL